MVAFNYIAFLARDDLLWVWVCLDFFQFLAQIFIYNTSFNLCRYNFGMIFHWKKSYNISMVSFQHIFMCSFSYTCETIVTHLSSYECINTRAYAHSRPTHVFQFSLDYCWLCQIMDSGMYNKRKEEKGHMMTDILTFHPCLFHNL